MPKKPAYKSERAGSWPNEDRVEYLCRQVLSWEETYRTNHLTRDARNLAYYRGEFWGDESFGGVVPGDVTTYQTERNVIAPLVQTLTSKLVMSTPQVEGKPRGLDPRSTPEPEKDRTFSAERVAATLNHFAEEDELDESIEELVICAILFDRGGLLKWSWDAELSRIVFESLLPWEWGCDPDAKRFRDAHWVCQRFPVHIEELNDLVRQRIYKRPKEEIHPDSWRRDINQQLRVSEDDARTAFMARHGSAEHVHLVEYWDRRNGRLYHLHPETMQCLLASDMPWRSPFARLDFMPALGRVGGISDVTLGAKGQRDINEMVTALRETVTHLQERTLIDDELFETQEAFEDFVSARATEPTRVKRPESMGSLREAVVKVGGHNVGFDFHQYLNGAEQALHYLLGTAEYQRGQSVNIRTAAEAMMIRGATEGRLDRRGVRVEKVVLKAFKGCQQVLRWAINNPDQSGVDLYRLHEDIEPGVQIGQWVQELMLMRPRLRLLPFSPLMENVIERRQHLVALLPQLASNPEMMSHINIPELVREIVDVFGLRPSIYQDAPAQPSAPSMPDMMGGALPDGGLPGGMMGGEIPAMPSAGDAAMLQQAISSLPGLGAM